MERPVDEKAKACKRKSKEPEFEAAQLWTWRWPAAQNTRNDQRACTDRPGIPFRPHPIPVLEKSHKSSNDNLQLMGSGRFPSQGTGSPSRSTTPTPTKKTPFITTSSSTSAMLSRPSVRLPEEPHSNAKGLAELEKRIDEINDQLRYVKSERKRLDSSITGEKRGIVKENRMELIREVDAKIERLEENRVEILETIERIKHPEEPGDRCFPTLNKDNVKDLDHYSYDEYLRKTHGESPKEGVTYLTRDMSWEDFL